MAVLRIEGIEGRKAIGAEADRLDCSERAEIVENAQRIEAVPEGVGLVVQRDAVCAGRRHGGCCDSIARAMR